MASWEICIVISLGYSLLSVSTISRGDQHFRSPEMTISRNLGSWANRDFPLRRTDAERFALVRAENARYPVLPLFLPISLETVDG